MEVKIEATVTCMDFSELCRFCLKYGQVIKLSKQGIIATYRQITNLTIEVDDLLPQTACDECIEKLEKICDFIELCKNSHDFLTNVVESEQTLEDKKTLQEMLLYKAEPNNSIILEIISDISGDEDENTVLDSKSMIQTKNEIVIKEVLKSELSNTNENCNKEKLKKKKIYKCKKFKKGFCNLKLLKLHSSIHVDTNDKTEKKSYICKICHMNFSCYSTLKRHKFVHRVPVMKNEKDLMEHSEKLQEIINGKRKWKCTICNKLFGKKHDLQRHLCIHTGVRPHACTMCSYTFIQRTSLKRHIEAVHTVKDIEKKKYYECYICERKFYRKNNIEMHVAKTHIKRINEDSFNNPLQKCCNLCGKTFSTYSYTKQHEVAHMKIEPQPPRKRNPSGLKKFRYPTSSKLCSICGKTFEKRSTLYGHMFRNHRPPDRPKMQTKPKSANKTKKVFQCWHCGHIMSSECNLKVHMRIHTGEKPFECKYCYKKFSARGTWQEHENIHTGFRPFQCKFCKKSFKHRSSLRKHLISSIHSKTEEK